MQRLRLLARTKWPTTGNPAAADRPDAGHALPRRRLRHRRSHTTTDPLGRTERPSRRHRRQRGFCRAARGRRRGKDFRPCFMLRGPASSRLMPRSTSSNVRFLLTHLPEPLPVLAWMAQTARAGGVVVVEDIDFSGLLYATQSAELHHAISSSMSRWCVRTAPIRASARGCRSCFARPGCKASAWKWCSPRSWKAEAMPGGHYHAAN